MRLAPYYAYLLTVVTGPLATLAILTAAAGTSATAALALCSVAAAHHLAVGFAIGFDVRGMSRQLRALQRIQGRRRGRAWRWFCRDTPGWWRGVGIACAAIGLVYAWIAVGLTAS
jgi:hypothetical protein